MPVSEATYCQLALEDVHGGWELYDGELRQKPGMTTEHNETMHTLGILLGSQLDRAAYRVRINSGRTRRSARNYFIPDVAVIPAALVRARLGHPQTLEAFDEPLPLVVEVWSRSTGDYDVSVKLAEYQRRGDLEIWYIHPYERTLTRWQRQENGSYTESLARSGPVRPMALPGVSVDLDQLFAF